MGRLATILIPESEFDELLAKVSSLEEKVTLLEKVNKPSPFYTIKEVAKRLHCSEKTVRNNIKKGLIRGRKIDHKILIREDDLQKALKTV